MRNKSNKGLVLGRMVVWLLNILGKMEGKDIERIVVLALIWSRRFLIQIVKLEMILWKDINVFFIEQSNIPEEVVSKATSSLITAFRGIVWSL